MFDRLELSPKLSKYLVSISPILGITGSIADFSLQMITKYFSLDEEKVLVELHTEVAPDELSLNLLRKGEDPILIAAITGFPIDEKYFQKGKRLDVPIYLNSVISFEGKLEETIKSSLDYTLAVYKIVQVSGVAGLDPDFNDDITIAKTLEIMTLASVDTYIINKKTEK